MEAAPRVSPERSAWPQAAALVSALSGAAVCAWLWPASIHVTAWDRSGPARVAVFAPIGRLAWAMGIAAAALLVVWTLTRGGRFPRATIGGAAGALSLLWLLALPYAPWAADRFPLLLLLAGPLRWAVLATAAGILAFRMLRVPSAMRVLSWAAVRVRPRQRLAVFLLSFAVYLLIGLWSEGATGVHGDEPHYLIITQSLLADGDIAIENNHRTRDYRAYYAGELTPHYVVRGRDGRIYSIHGPGLPALLLPGFATAGVRGAIATMAFAAALAALAVFALASLIAGAGVAWLVWAAVALTVPFIPHAWSIFPEIFATAIVGWAVVVLANRMQRTSLDSDPKGAGHERWRWILLGLGLGVLPWLHIKFVPVLAITACCLLVTMRRELKLAAVFLAPIATAGIAWLGSFLVMYGTPDPRAPWIGGEGPTLTLANVPRGLLGLFFDQTFGLFIYAPVYLLAFAGGWLLFRDERWRGFTIALAAIAAAHIITCAQAYIWWGGTSPPARFLVPVLPLFAPLVAAAIDRARGPVATAATWSSLAATSAIAVAGVYGLEQRWLYGDRSTRSRVLELLQGQAPVTSLLPGFTGPDGLRPADALWPWVAAGILSVVLVRALAARWGAFRLSLTVAFGTAFLVVASALAGPVSAEARSAIVQQGRLALLEEFDPDARRAIAYKPLRPLPPAEWLRAAVIRHDPDPAHAGDSAGLITGPLALPPGRYVATVWLQGSRRGSGAFEVTLGLGQTVAASDEPLDNPSVVQFDLPLLTPAVWLRLTDPGTAARARRTELTASTVVPASERPAVRIRGVASISAPGAAYIAFVDEDTFPERGAFWTRGTDQGDVLVAAEGGSELVVNLRNGAVANTVRVTAGTESLTVAMDAEATETRVLPIPQPLEPVRVSVRASASFRPIDVDSQSADRRDLGCFVRLELR